MRLQLRHLVISAFVGISVSVPGLVQSDVLVTRFDKFQEAPISAVQPQGWLKEFLARQKTGLTGHPEAMSYPYDRTWWGDTLQKDNVPEVFWWPYEQTGYYTDALTRLAYLLRDKELLAKANPIIDNVLNNPQKSGRLGPNLFSCQWPIAVFFRVLQAEYLATGKQSVIDALHKHFLTYSVKDVAGDMRHIVNVEGILWTYGKTGDRKLLDLAEAAYAESNRLKLGGELTFDMCASPDPIGIHGVTHMEEAKLPAILYTYTGKKKYLDAAINIMKKVDRDHMLVDGVPSSYENLHGQDPIEGHESCDITDYTWALGYLLMATGDASWADHIERAVFNAGPGAMSKDFKQVQYFSCPNQVIATGNSNHLDFFKGLTWMQYRPFNQVECCVGDIQRFMPNYATRMWMKTEPRGRAAVLYGPCTEIVPMPGGGSAVIEEKTDYPFGDTITFTFKKFKRLSMPFTFRIPGWCTKPSVKVNGENFNGKLVPGTFATIDRLFNEGDKIVLRFPMEAKVNEWGKYGVYVERGPLLYAYAIPEKVTPDTKLYDNIGGKKFNNPDFPALDLQPEGPWNYALVGNAQKTLKVVKTGKKGYPFDITTTPWVIKVSAVRVKNWGLVENRYTPPLPEIGKFECEGPIETIALVPYGSTRLRVSVFPKGK
jgi:hypothetical protein